MAFLNVVIDGRNPWRNILLKIPFSQYVFIAGSAATWMAEYALFETEPAWVPGDIDVFVLYPESMFETLVATFMAHHVDSIGSAIRKRRNVVDIVLNPSLSCEPALSFVRCLSAGNDRDVIGQFDIDVCKVVINRFDGVLQVKVAEDVLAQIRDRQMHCFVRKRTPRSLQYPLQKTLLRMMKYRSRGYKCMSILLESSNDHNFPEYDSELLPEDFAADVTMINALRVWEAQQRPVSAALI